MPIQNFGFTGAEVTFIVPAGVTSMLADLAGAQGGQGGIAGNIAGGKGARLQATMTVTPGETLRLGVAGAGGGGAAETGPSPGGFYQGGASGSGSAAGGGGGQSYIKRGGAADSNRILVAAGGGGATTAVGGAGGTALDTEANTPNVAGSGSVTDAAGGGGGWRGGAAGVASNDPGQGGTSMRHSTQTSSPTHTPDFQNGNGYITLSWNNPPGTTIARRFYPTAGADDQTFTSEATIRALDDDAPAANTTTTVTWTTATITEKTVRPVTANAADGDQSINNGWAFNNSADPGLNSVAQARRKILAGAWNFSMQMTLNTPAVLDTHALTITARVYRVATGGGTRTLLFSATSANQTASATVTWSSASQPQIILGAGEVILVGFTATSASTQALVLGANTNTVMTVALGANTWVEVPDPGIRTDYAQEANIIGDGVETRVLAVAASRSATGDGVPTESRSVSASKSFSLVGDGAVTRMLAPALSRSVTGDGVPTESRSVQASKTFNLTGDGTATRTLAPALSRQATGDGVATESRSVQASKTFTVTGDGVVTETRSVQAQRSFSLTGDGVPTRNVAVALSRNATGDGTVTESRSVNASKTFNLTGDGSVTRVVAVELDRDVTGDGVVTEARTVQAQRSFSLVGTGNIVITGPNASTITIPIDEVPSGEGGGGTTYPDGLLVLRTDGRIISVPGAEGAPPPGTLRITALP